jgi:NAD(P)-dependent dehydrogenase (short-subunit alcohol dehydrogenase family)
MNSTAQQVADSFAEIGKQKTFLVTGANSGLGLETAKTLATTGAKVILTSRSVENGDKALRNIKESVKDADICCLQLDLGSLESISSFVKTYTAEFDKLDVLIANAGITCLFIVRNNGLS